MPTSEADLIKSMKPQFGPETSLQRMRRVNREAVASQARTRRNTMQEAANIFYVLVNNLKSGLYFDDCGCMNCKRIRYAKVNNPDHYNSIVKAAGRADMEIEVPKKKDFDPWLSGFGESKWWAHITELYNPSSGLPSGIRFVSGEQQEEVELRAYDACKSKALPGSLDIYGMVESIGDGVGFQGYASKECVGVPDSFKGKSHAFTHKEPLEGRVWVSFCGVEAEVISNYHLAKTKSQSSRITPLPQVVQLEGWSRCENECEHCKGICANMYTDQLKSLGWDGKIGPGDKRILFGMDGRFGTFPSESDAHKYFSAGWVNGESFMHFLEFIVSGTTPLGSTRCRHYSRRGVRVAHDTRELPKCPECLSIYGDGGL